MTEPTFVISPHSGQPGRTDLTTPRAFADGDIVVGRVEAGSENEGLVLRIGSTRFAVPADARLQEGTTVLLRVVNGGPSPTMELIGQERAGGPASSMSPGILERLGLPLTEANRAAVEVLTTAGAPVTRDNIQLVTYAVGVSDLPEELTAKAAAFLLKAGVPPEATLVRTFVAVLGQYQGQSAHDMASVLTQMLVVSGQLRSEMPELHAAVSEFLDSIPIDPASPELAARLQTADMSAALDRLDGQLQTIVARLLATNPAIVVAGAVIDDLATAIPDAPVALGGDPVLERLAALVIVGQRLSAADLGSLLGGPATPEALSAGAAASELYYAAAQRWLAAPSDSSVGAAVTLETVLAPVGRSAAALAVILGALHQARALTPEEATLVAAVLDTPHAELAGVSGGALEAIATGIARELAGGVSLAAAEQHPLWQAFSALLAEMGDRAAVLTQLAEISQALGVDLGLTATGHGLPAVADAEALQALAAQFAGIREVLSGLGQPQANTVQGQLQELLQVVQTRLQSLLAALGELETAAARGGPGFPAGRVGELMDVMENIMDQRALLRAVERADRNGAREILTRILAGATRGRLAALRETLAVREQAVIERVPAVASLRELYDAFSAVRQRTALFKVLSAATENQPVQTLVAEFVLKVAGQLAPARLRARIKRSRKRRKGPMRFVLDVSMSNLGEVWAEAEVDKPSVSLSFDLDREEVARVFEAHKDELVERLVACGYNPAVSIRVTDNARRSLFDDANVAPGDVSSLDVEA